MDRSDVVNNPYRRDIENGWCSVAVALANEAEPKVPIIGIHRYSVKGTDPVEYDMRATVSSTLLSKSISDGSDDDDVEIDES